MRRPLVTVSAAWALAIGAALAGVLQPSDRLRLSVALFAFAVALALLVAIVLVADGLRHRRSRRRATATAAGSPLDRLEYLPSVTTPSRRLVWHGSPYWAIGGQGGAGVDAVALELQGTAQPEGTRPETLPVTAAR
jgi:peptidoglycan/LPS O-acetylase OafA/YrhL